MRMIKSHNSTVLLLFSVALTSPALASLVLHNYDGDPNLAAAMQYDWGETNDRSKADRGLAEKYYLEYLKKFAERWDFEVFIEYVSLDDANSGLEFHFEPSRCRTPPAGGVILQKRSRC